MQFHPNELFIYYNPSTSVGKQCVAYAQSLCRNVNKVDCEKIPLTTTLWKEIVNIVGVKPKDFLDKSKPEYQDKIARKTFNMTGWLEVLKNNPHLIKAPVVIFKKKGIICTKPTDILKLDISGSSSVKTPPHL